MRMRTKRRNMSRFKKHRHMFKVGRMRGLTSVPLRYRGKRI